MRSSAVRSLPSAPGAAVDPTGYVLATDIDPSWLTAGGGHEVRRLVADPPRSRGRSTWCTPGSCWSTYPTTLGRWPPWQQRCGSAAGSPLITPSPTSEVGSKVRPWGCDVARRSPSRQHHQARDHATATPRFPSWGHLRCTRAAGALLGTFRPQSSDVVFSRPATMPYRAEMLAIAADLRSTRCHPSSCRR